jgi:hypothetical protein
VTVDADIRQFAAGHRNQFTGFGMLRPHRPPANAERFPKTR